MKGCNQFPLKIIGLFKTNGVKVMKTLGEQLSSKSLSSFMKKSNEFFESKMVILRVGGRGTDRATNEQSGGFGGGGLVRWRVGEGGGWEDNRPSDALMVWELGGGGCLKGCEGVGELIAFWGKLRMRMSGADSAEAGMVMGIFFGTALSPCSSCSGAPLDFLPLRARDRRKRPRCSL